ncbi:Dehydrogenase (flavoprotein) [Nitrosospira sp. Nl5]|uniref:NAD(P)/FAD-dependent oxidoreductase n=1 Tax=Nitrosospira sp. Nl5 TaxID=200120 RepID=UPI00088A48F3|nr:NAD(P)/FAD-dependent oxidoreductase [Nitrosospira sp. Nl5]SCX90807.1 Dehydrogenase (flavoprotein) [Nitrosospira sp. Nl5]
MAQSGSRQSIDAVVVGGGPAGAICALTLARGGARVSLVHWDGYSIGGIELVSGRARRLIEQHCPDFFLQVAPGIEVNETVSLWGTPGPVRSSAMFNPWGAGVALERELLDRALRNLASTAGVSVIPDTKVVGIARRSDRWELSLRLGEGEDELLHARFVVLATGRAAARFFDQTPMAESSQIALMASLGQQSDAPGHALHVEAMDNGWWYALPAADGRHFAGFCTSREVVKQRDASLRDFFSRELHRTRLLTPLMTSAEGNPCNTRSARISRITGRTADVRPFSKAAGEGWIAVGDAAFAPDALSGMGIELAIESAQRGAHALLEAIRTAGQHDVFAAYEDSIHARAMRHHETAVAYRYREL